MKNMRLLFGLYLFSIFNGTAQEWQLNIKDAKKIAQVAHMPIILVFQGSDWCAPCIKLDQEVWRTKVFTDYAAAHFVLLKADFPKRKKNALSASQVKSNAILAEQYNTNGTFPLVVVLDAFGNLLGKTSYKNIPPEAYIKELNLFLN